MRIKKRPYSLYNGNLFLYIENKGLSPEGKSVVAYTFHFIGNHKTRKLEFDKNFNCFFTSSNSYCKAIILIYITNKQLDLSNGFNHVQMNYDILQSSFHHLYQKNCDLKQIILVVNSPM